MAPINNSPKKSPRKKNGRLQQPLLQIAEVSTDARMKPKSSIPVATGARAPSVTGLRDYYEKQRSPPRGLPTSTQQFTRIDQVAAMSISSGKSTRQEMPSTSGVEVASSSSSTFKNNEASEATPLLAAPKLSLPTALATSPSPSITTEGSTTSNRTNSQQSEDTPIFKNTLKNARKKQKKKAKRYLAASESSISSDNSAATIIPVSTIHSPSPSIGTLRSVYGVGVSRTRNQHEGYGGTDNEVRRESSAMGSRHTSQATLESFPALDKDESWQLKQSQRLPSNASNFTIPFPFNTFGPFRHNGASTTASEANARERAGTETEIETVVHHTREQIDTIYTRTTTLHPIHVRDLGFLPGGTRIHGDMQTDSSDDKGSVDYEQHRTWNDFWVDVIWVARNILEIIVFVVGCLALGVVIGALMKWLAWDWIEDQFCRGTCGFFGRRF